MYNVDTLDGIRLGLGLPFNIVRSVSHDVLGRFMPLVSTTGNWWDAVLVHLGLKEGATIRFRDGAEFGLTKDSFTEFVIRVERENLRLRGNLDREKVGPLRKLKIDERIEAQLMAEFNGEDHACLDVEGKEVVDVGAYVGDSALYYVLKGGAKHVCAIEAYTHYCDMGISLVRANRLSDRIRFYNCAVGGKDGTVYTSKSNSDFEIRKSKDRNHTVPMKCYSLDSLAKKLRIGRGAALKVDIEGSEYDVFGSASDATLDGFSGIHIEYHYGYADLVERLRAAGFEVRRTKPVYRFKGFGNRAMIMGDVIATRHQEIKK
jgi:FkbM family methyltransferase